MFNNDQTLGKAGLGKLRYKKLVLVLKLAL